MAILFTLKVFARNLLRGNRRRYIFLFCFDVYPVTPNPGFTFNKPTYYLLDYDDNRATKDCQSRMYIEFSIEKNDITRPLPL